MLHTNREEILFFLPRRINYETSPDSMDAKTRYVQKASRSVSRRKSLPEL